MLMVAGETLTVITPSFNYAGYIGDCIDSVLRQDSSMSVQHVIIDDGSTDDSWAIIREKHPTWERDCVQQTNRGLAATLNRALSMATGDWLLWLNADDFLLPDALRLARRAMLEVPGASIVYGDTIFVDESSRFLRLVAQPAFDRRILEGGYNCFHTPSVLWRRRLLPPGGGWDESLSLLLDLDLWLTITSGGPTVVKVNAALSAFRRHYAQISATRRPTDGDEARRVAARHRLPIMEAAVANSSQARPATRVKVFHGWLKVLEGGWAREWAMRRYRGQSANWMKGAFWPTPDVSDVTLTVRGSRPGV